MSQATEHPENTPNPTADPYVLTPDAVREPPKSFRQSVRFFGPGLVVSASVVGSGELIATTALGAQAGFALLWLIIASTTVKVAVQIEFARWTIATGTPALSGLDKVPPRIGGRVGWITVLWLAMALAKIVQLGGVLGGTVAACSILMPVGGDPLGRTSLAVWTVIIVVVTVVMLYSNRYGLIERGAVALVAVFVLMTLAISAGLPFTDFGYDGGDLLSGLTLSIPAGALGIAIAAFGITGVGSDEIVAYQYWCLEKGYARFTGPNDGSAAWARRADGWIKVMYRDAMLSWVVYTVATLAFFVMGASVLHPQGLVPEGNNMIVTLSRMYTDALGEWANTAYLLGAVAALGSTLWASLPSWTRAWTNALSTLGVLRWEDAKVRTRWVRALTVAFPVIWGIEFMMFPDPVLMIKVGGFAGALFLLALVVAVWYLRRTGTDTRLRGSRTFEIALVVSSAAIALLGIYTLLNTFGFEIG